MGRSWVGLGRDRVGVRGGDGCGCGGGRLVGWDGVGLRVG